MNFNYQKARELMVENQLRPNKINDLNILNLFKTVPKEKFLPSSITKISYSDVDIKMLSNRGYLKNLHLAQLIKSAEIKKNHKVLHLGALTGYFTVLLSNLCSEVTAIESDNELCDLFKEKINELEIQNIEIINKDFIKGYFEGAPYDRIIIDTPISVVDDSILNQLNENLGKLIIIRKINVNLCKAVSITKNKDSFSEDYLFDVFSEYELFKQQKGFEF